MKPAAHHLRADTGMTLVEVLVVIFIMGLVSAVAVMTMPQRPGPYERAVRDVRQALEAANDRSILTGEVIGLHPTERGFDVVGWTGEEWLPLPQSGFTLPRDVRLTILAPEGETRGRKKELDRIVFNPLGSTEPVLLELSHGVQSHRLELTPEGSVIDAKAS